MPTDPANVDHALLRALARSLDDGGIAVEQAMEHVATRYERRALTGPACNDALADLYALREDLALAQDRLIDVAPEDVRREFHDQLRESVVGPE